MGSCSSSSKSSVPLSPPKSKEDKVEELRIIFANRNTPLTQKQLSRLLSCSNDEDMIITIFEIAYYEHDIRSMPFPTKQSHETFSEFYTRHAEYVLYNKDKRRLSAYDKQQLIHSQNVLQTLTKLYPDIQDHMELELIMA
jgi:hypothetical protein